MFMLKFHYKYITFFYKHTIKKIDNQKLSIYQIKVVY